MSRDIGLDPVEKAREAALSMLDRTRKTRREIERRLVERGHPKDAIAAALERLERVGLVDDVEYARAFVRAKLARKPVSARVVRAQLRGRGVSEGDLERAFEETKVAAPEGERARAARALAPLLRRYRGLDAREARAKAAAALARRGFDYETVNDVLRDAASAHLGERVEARES